MGSAREESEASRLLLKASSTHMQLELSRTFQSLRLPQNPHRSCPAEWRTRRQPFPTGLSMFLIRFTLLMSHQVPIVFNGDASAVEVAGNVSAARLISREGSQASLWKVPDDM